MSTYRISFTLDAPSAHDATCKLGRYLDRSDPAERPPLLQIEDLTRRRFYRKCATWGTAIGIFTGLLAFWGEVIWRLLK